MTPSDGVRRPIVVKIGGAIAGAADRTCDDVARLHADGARVVVVHGGSGEIEKLTRRLGGEPRDVLSPDGRRSRYTDPETLDVLTLALRGGVAPVLTSMLVRRGVPALGMGGFDLGLVRARRNGPFKGWVDGRLSIVRDDQAGRIDRVDGECLKRLMELPAVPLLSPPVASDDGGLLNVDADRLAAAVAVAVGAEALVFLTDVPGVLTDPGDERTVSPAVTFDDLDAVASGCAGGMRRKLLAAGKAGAALVDHVVIADGRVEQPISRALGGAGTRIVARVTGRTGGSC